MHIIENDKNEEIKTKKIDELIIIDRNVDMITPLMTQMTYEGLIDEIIGISCGKKESIK